MTTDGVVWVDLTVQAPPDNNRKETCDEALLCFGHHVKHN